MGSTLRPRVGRPHMPGYAIAGPDEGRGLLPWSWAEERLTASRNYWVATVRPDGAPHCMPVWGVWTGEDFGFSTGERSRKARNLAADARCVVTSERADEAVIVEGRAERARDGAWLRRVAEAYEAKYAWKIEDDQGPLYRVRPRVAFGFIEAEEDFPTSATRWVFDDRPT